MKRSDVRNAYDLMTPTRSQKDKMLEAILSRPVNGKNSQGRYERRQEENHRVSWTAIAAAVLCLVIGGIALTKMAAPDVAQLNSGAADWLRDTAMYQASAEWAEYTKHIDKSQGIDAPYPYNLLECFSQEDVEALDSICRERGLKMLSREAVGTDSFSHFLEKVQIDTFFRVGDGVAQETDDFWFSPEGEYLFTGTTTMTYDGSVWTYPVDYVFRNLPKDYFHYRLWQLCPIEQYTYWSYTTSAGQELLLCMGENLGLILAEKENSIILIEVETVRVGDILYGEQTMSPEALEAFAETFDYSLTPGKVWLPEEYEYILTKYQAGVDNGWTAEQYMNNDLSILPVYLQNPEDLGYCLMDLDGNGYEELLVGTDNVIFDLFTYNEEMGLGHLLSAGENSPYTLCEERIIHHAGNVGLEVASHTFLRLSGIDLLTEKVLVKKENGWEAGTKESQTSPVSEQEMQAILDVYGQLEIKYQPFIKAPQEFNALTFTDGSYVEILQKYASAVAEGWDKAKCQENGISWPCMEAPEKLGYYLLDISGDGIEELFIGDGEVFYDMYGQSGNGKPFHALYTFEGENDPFILCEDGIIKRTTYGGAGEIYHIFYRMADSISLSPVHTVFYDPNAKEGPWFHGVTDTSAKPVSADQAQTVLDSYKPMTVEVTRFAGKEETDHLSPSYANLLMLYSKAVQENWDMGTCQNKGISYLTAFLEDIQDIGYTFIDLDGNGYEELIVSDGNLIYDLYTRQNDGIISLLSSGERTRYYLCENNVIAYHGSNSAASSIYSYNVVEGGELKEIESVHYNAGVDVENPWFHCDGVSDVLIPISESEAKEIMDGYKKVSIETRDIQWGTE